MRKKIIRTFLGVYLAICVTYGVVRGVTSPAIAEGGEASDAPSVQTTAEPEPERTAQIEELVVTPAPDTTSSSAQQETPYASGEFFGRSGRGRGRHGSGEMGFGSFEMGEGSFEMDEDSFATGQSAPASAAAPVSGPASDTGDRSDESDDEENGDASEPAAIPTLQEYLKNLHCGGCGRNCFLLNPRCMRGARKESMAESAYYEQYSQEISSGT